jgi:hypothetical protein
VVAEPTTLDDFARLFGAPRPTWVLDLVRPEIGGGRLGVEDLVCVEDRPDARVLRVSGLDQRAFVALVARHGRQFLAIDFWKCPRIVDLTPLEDLRNLRLVSFYWNQRATRLWRLTRNPHLTGLSFRDFGRLHDLDDLRRGAALTELVFGDAVANASTFESLTPLAVLTSLRSLRFTARRIDDGRIEPLAALQRLETIWFPLRMFSLRQMAWLRARLPGSLQSECLAPIAVLDTPLVFGGQPKDVALLGKRGRFLNSEADAAQISTHVDRFWRMVEEFRENPAMGVG